MKEEKNVIVDGNEISMFEYAAMLQNPKIKLKEISENNYKTLQRLHG